MEKLIIPICLFFIWCSPAAADVTALNKTSEDTFVAADVDQLDANDASLQAEIDGIQDGSVALTTPVLGTPTSGTLTNATGLPISTGVSGLGTGNATALGINAGSTGGPVLYDGDAGTPSYIDLTNAIMETDTDPDVITAGKFSYDTDGAIKSLIDSGGGTVTVTTDAIMRMYTSVGQWAAAQRLKVLVIPFDTDGAVTNYQPWPNLSGMTFTWEYAYFRSDTTGVVITVDEFTSIGNLTNLNEVVSSTVSTAGTNVYWEFVEASDGGVTDTEIEHGHGLSFDISAAAEGFVVFIGWENANVD